MNSVMTSYIENQEVNPTGTKKEYFHDILRLSSEIKEKTHQISSEFAPLLLEHKYNNFVFLLGKNITASRRQAEVIYEWAQNNANLNHLPSDDDCFQVLKLMHENMKTTNNIVAAHNEIGSDIRLMDQLGFIPAYGRDLTLLLDYQSRLKMLVRHLRLAKYGD